MGHTFVEFYYHFVWATKHREAYIVPEVEQVLYPAILAKCQSLEVHVYALNGMADHVHVVCAIPPKLAIAEVLKHIKGSSSNIINHLPERASMLYWQPGFYGRTFARRELRRVTAYVGKPEGTSRSGHNLGGVGVTRTRGDNEPARSSFVIPVASVFKPWSSVTGLRSKDRGN